MPTALQITSRLHVTSLLDIHYPTFEKLYRDGIWWSLFKEHNDGSVTDHYVIENLRALLAEAYADEQPDERTCTDAKLMERFQELQRESVTFRDGEATWYYAIGCILGELSGRLFSATSEEYIQWEAERQKWLAEYEQTTHQETDTELLDPVPTVR